MEKEFLSIKNVVKKYDDNENNILNGLSLDVHEGEVIVIIGPSGCGKSTLLRCINGLEPIQNGSISFLGEVVNSAKGVPSNIYELRQKIGMVFQSYDLFPHKTVLENIMMAPLLVQKREKNEIRKEALELLKKVGLFDKANSYPRQLSGGQKQRVAIVRALCVHPEVLLFDEVTAALDTEMVREVLNVIMALAKQGRTMLIVTHELSFAKAVAQRIIFVDNGKIIEEGTPKEFFENPKTQRAKEFLNILNFDEE